MTRHSISWDLVGFQEQSIGCTLDRQGSIVMYRSWVVDVVLSGTGACLGFPISRSWLDSLSSSCSFIWVSCSVWLEWKTAAFRGQSPTILCWESYHIHMYLYLVTTIQMLLYLSWQVSDGLLQALILVSSWGAPKVLRPEDGSSATINENK